MNIENWSSRIVFFAETQMIDLFHYENKSFGDHADKIKQIGTKIGQRKVNG